MCGDPGHPLFIAEPGIVSFGGPILIPRDSDPLYPDPRYPTFSGRRPHVRHNRHGCRAGAVPTNSLPTDSPPRQTVPRQTAPRPFCDNPPSCPQIIPRNRPQPFRSIRFGIVPTRLYRRPVRNRPPTFYCYGFQYSSPRNGRQNIRPQCGSARGSSPGNREES